MSEVGRLRTRLAEKISPRGPSIQYAACEEPVALPPAQSCPVPGPKPRASGLLQDRPHTQLPPGPRTRAWARPGPGGTQSHQPSGRVPNGFLEMCPRGHWSSFIRVNPGSPGLWGGRRNACPPPPPHPGVWELQESGALCGLGWEPRNPFLTKMLTLRQPSTH